MKIINATRFPDSHFDVDTWVNTFKAFLGVQKLINYAFFDSLLKDITLYFSEEKLESPYQIKDLNYIKECFLKKWPFLEILLNNINSLDELNNDLRGLADPASSRGNQSFDDILKEMKKIISEARYINGPFSFYRAGDYDPYTNTIRIFVNVIESSKNPHLTYMEVFAHELFHAIHYDNARLYNEIGGTTDFDLIVRTDYTSTVVKESLAAYFEDAFNKYIGNPVNLKDDWDNFSADEYPYSGARYLNDTIFTNIYIDSYTDVDIALRKLISDVFVFYAIKNKKTVKYLSKPVISKPKHRYGLSTGKYAKKLFKDLLLSRTLSSNDIKELMDKDYCRHAFGLSYPVLVDTTGLFDNKRYYSEVIDGQYRITNMWYDYNRPKIDEWLEHKEGFMALIDE